MLTGLNLGLVNDGWKPSWRDECPHPWKRRNLLHSKEKEKKKEEKAKHDEENYKEKKKREYERERGELTSLSLISLERWPGTSLSHRGVFQ